jgi:uncharacterized low-complexity protein
MKKLTLKPISATIGATFAVSLVAMPLANATENPFELKEFSGSYTVAEGEGACAEGKCAEGTCGGPSGEGTCAEGKCAEGKCGGPPSE